MSPYPDVKTFVIGTDVFNLLINLPIPYLGKITLQYIFGPKSDNLTF